MYVVCIHQEDDAQWTIHQLNGYYDGLLRTGQLGCLCFYLCLNFLVGQKGLGSQVFFFFDLKDSSTFTWEARFS